MLVRYTEIGPAYAFCFIITDQRLTFPKTSKPAVVKFILGTNSAHKIIKLYRTTQFHCNCLSYDVLQIYCRCISSFAVQPAKQKDIYALFIRICYSDP